MSELVEGTQRAAALEFGQDLFGADVIGGNLMASVLANGQSLAGWWGLADRSAIATWSGGDWSMLFVAADLAATRTLASAVAATRHRFPSVRGELTRTGEFAVTYSLAAGVGAVPTEAQVAWVLEDLVVPQVDGSLRPAGDADRERAEDWAVQFGAATGIVNPEAARALIARGIDGGALRFWDVDGEPVAMGIAAHAVGQARIGWIFTDPAQRRHGYAAAITAAISSEALDAGADGCLLFTQLKNPSTPGIYGSVGYRPAGQDIEYSFAWPAD